MLTLVLMAALGAGLVFLRDADRPDVGECLTSMDRNLLGRFDTVACDDPDAAYEVVVSTRTSARNAANEVCRGHPGGESYVKTRRAEYGSRIAWALCAVPVSR